MSGTGFCHDDDATTPNDTTPDVGTWGVVGRPIGFHSFIDGVSYSVTYTVSVFTGVLATTGMVFHEFPEGIITYLLLLRSGFDPRRSLWLAVFAAALSTPKRRWNCSKKSALSCERKMLG